MAVSRQQTSAIRRMGRNTKICKVKDTDMPEIKKGTGKGSLFC
jgi:hypothetical protein